MKLNFDNRGRLSLAIAVTTHIHGDREGRGTLFSSLCHCLEVADLAAGETDDEEILLAALFHDLPEYYPKRVSLVEQYFGPRVTELMQLEKVPPNCPNTAENWQRRKLFAIDALKEENEEIKLLVLCDKLSELREIDQYGAHRLGLHVHPTKLRWYYTSLLNALPELRRTAPYEEYVRRLARFSRKQIENQLQRQ